MVKPGLEQSVEIPIGEGYIEGVLVIPDSAKGLVLFAHGSGSSRFSPRNQFVAETLQKKQLATLMLDLLTEEEESIDLETSKNRFNIEMLSERLIQASKWLKNHPQANSLAIGYFGSSTGAAAALIAAAREQGIVKAVVSRGGRPDLAAASLSSVKAPTLLIVGGADTVVIELNKQAFNQMICEKKMEIIPQATHLFEEPGALQEVAKLAGDWFNRLLMS